MHAKKILMYRTDAGQCPYQDWHGSLDTKARAIVDYNIGKLSKGGILKNVKALKDGVFELKIYHSSGFRIYFGQDGDRLILLLTGGDKSSQNRDIKRAKEFWRHYGKQTR